MRDEIILVTGGAGFIGSALVRHLIFETEASVLNVDALTYAANLSNLAAVVDHQRYGFEQADICSAPDLARIFARYRPTGVVHLAAETHVDRSIDHPLKFVETNVLGTATLLRAAFNYWRALRSAEKARFRFLHVSTDEVYGSLEDSGAFTEEAPYRPNSPYAASKAGADHLARAWHKTYGFPVLISNCSNNFGPYQFPEKLIPLLVHQWAGRVPHADLRAWGERARLAFCRGPCACARDDSARRTHWRMLQHRRRQSSCATSTLRA